MAKMIECQCGETVRGKDDDELVANGMKHVKDVHSGMQVTRDQLLAMAKPE